MYFQVGFGGLGLLCYSVFCFPQLRNPTEFYSAVAITLVSIAIFLHIILGFSAVLWLINLLIEDLLTVSEFVVDFHLQMPRQQKL